MDTTPTLDPPASAANPDRHPMLQIHPRVPASNGSLLSLVPVPVLDNVRRLDGGGTPSSSYIYPSGGSVVNGAVVQQEKGEIILGMLMLVVVGSST